MIADTAHSAIAHWINAANNGCADILVSLYAENAILLPTFSPHLLLSREDKRGYFERLTRQKSMQVLLHEKTLHVQELANHIESASGIYRFSFEIDNEPLTFESRFTYVFDFKQPAPIVTHHSSQVPRNLS